MSLTRKFEDGFERCSWLNSDPTYISYHDNEWGQKLTGDKELFEAIALEGFQAGLSWFTILRRREGFRSAFEKFEIAKVAGFDQAKVDQLMLDERIIRNRSKILATIHNARLIQDQNLNLTELMWSFAPRAPKQPEAGFKWHAESEESKAMSAALRKLGFKFVGPTTMHALMQSTGMIQDHAPNCHWRR